MTDVVRRLAGLDDDGQAGDTWIGTAQITTADAGTTADGRRLCQITWHGTAHTCGYLAPYTPVVGDYVTFLKAGSSVLVIGKPART